MKLLVKTLTVVGSQICCALLILALSGPAFAIDAPPNVRGSEVAPATLVWEWDAISDASEYELTLDDTTEVRTSDTSYQQENVGVGEHTLSVRSIAADGEKSGPSGTAIAITGSESTDAASGVNDALSDDTEGAGADEGDGVAESGEEDSAADASGDESDQSESTQSESTQSESTQSETAPSETASSETASSDTAPSETAPSETAPGDGSSEGVEDNAEASAADAGNDESAASATGADGSLVDPASASQADVAKPGYRLVFSDEFNGSGLDASRWNGQLRWDGDWNGERFEYRIINGEHQFYVNPISDDQEMLSAVVPTHNPFQFDGSRLAIRAVRNPLFESNQGPDYGGLGEMVGHQEFLSGAMSTYDKFSQKYGYFEARMKIPSQTGTFPAFWLYHQRSVSEGTKRTEIDIMENLGHAPQYIYNSFHYHTGVSTSSPGNHHFVTPQPSGQIYSGADYSENYHTYAVEWEPGRVAWLIDGQVVSELADENVNHEELYLIINLAIGGNWTNFPANAGGLGRSGDQYFPNSEDLQSWSSPALEIDYVRVYSRN